MKNHWCNSNTFLPLLAPIACEETKSHTFSVQLQTCEHLPSAESSHKESHRLSFHPKILQSHPNSLSSPPLPLIYFHLSSTALCPLFSSHLHNGFTIIIGNKRTYVSVCIDVLEGFHSCSWSQSGSLGGLASTTLYIEYLEN
ncbi:unnamed protein product [Ilex paraguariensis]|uniref:Uncharacterized protein n=1 Tax=Ilex paraguariensis TaxID=185542 RepID=A0ABC8UA25_9AQUA